MKKILIYVGVAFLVLYMAYNPAACADALKAIGEGIQSMAIGFGQFIKSLVA